MQAMFASLCVLVLEAVRACPGAFASCVSTWQASLSRRLLCAARHTGNFAAHLPYYVARTVQDAAPDLAGVQPPVHGLHSCAQACLVLTSNTSLKAQVDLAGRTHRATAKRIACHVARHAFAP